MIFEAPDGLRYDTTIHDFIEPDGTLASAQRVADAWGMTKDEIEQDRNDRAEWRQRHELN